MAVVGLEDRAQLVEKGGESMNKRFLLISGTVVAALVLAGVIGVTVVSAQDPTPPGDSPFPLGGLHGFGGRGGRHGFGGRGGFGDHGLMGGEWTMFDTMAETLGLTPEELFSKSHGGMTLEEIAEEQGISLEDIEATMAEARTASMQEHIEQAVADGTMTQEQADWMLEGMEQGFFGGGRGFGRRGGSGGCWGSSDEE
jgi:hypothetical protein